MKSQLGFAHLLLVVLLLLGLAAGVYLIQTTQLLKSHAGSNPIIFLINGVRCDPSSSSCLSTTATVGVELTSTLGAPLSAGSFNSSLLSMQGLQKAFGSIRGDAKYDAKYDVNNDGKINITDLNTLKRNGSLSAASAPVSSPNGVGTVAYKMAESPTDLDAASYLPYSQQPVVTTYTFKNTAPGTKFLWAEFKDSTGKVDRRSGQINLQPSGLSSPITPVAQSCPTVPGLTATSGRFCKVRANLTSPVYVDCPKVDDSASTILKDCQQANECEIASSVNLYSQAQGGTPTQTDLGVMRCGNNIVKNTVKVFLHTAGSPTPQAKRVFVTSSSYNGDLKSAGSKFGLGSATSGLDGADKVCQGTADLAKLGGTWKAWLSDSKTSTSDRLNHSAIPYKLLNGTLVANNWSDLTDGSLQNGIDVTEYGQTRYPGVRTGTQFNGSVSGTNNALTCVDWMTDYGGGSALMGLAGKKDFQWTSANAYSCSAQLSLYCFEQ